MPIDTSKPGPVPVEAVEFFKKKGLRPAFSWTEVWREEHRRAHTVAKVLERDLLKDIKDSLASALEGGETFQTWKGKIRDTFDQSGWSQYGAGKSAPARLRTIYDTNMRMARAEGQWDRAQRTKDALPFFQYNLGPSVIHRENHAELDGLILPVDDPFWEKNSPPSGFGCRCYLRSLTTQEAEELGIGTAPEGDFADPSFDYPKGNRDAGLKRALEEAGT